jgi:hypothetical protein
MASASPSLAERAKVTKAREKRHDVVLRARLQTDGPFVDVCIRNISSRGMMLESPNPPRVGEFVELFGTVTAVGQVRWTDGVSFGIATRDRVNVPLILGRPEGKPQPVVPKAKASIRRKDYVEAAEGSRRIGRAIDFIFVALATVSFGVLFALLAYGVLSRPLDALGNLLR